MSPADNNNPPDRAAQLAHELANLLDGSLRHLGIAIDTLSQGTRPSQTANESDKPEDDNLLARLQTTDRAMRQMARLIHAWMKAAPQPGELFNQSQTLAQALQQVVDIHRSAAEPQGIRLDLDIDSKAGALSAGPVFPVISNAVLNSIQAITDSKKHGASDQPRISIAARLDGADICLAVTDNGPGLDQAMHDAQGQLQFGRSTKPDGHGLGLTLSRQIARSLQGSLELTNLPTGGARLTLRYPLAGLGVSADHHNDAPPRTTTPTLFE